MEIFPAVLQRLRDSVIQCDQDLAAIESPSAKHKRLIDDVDTRIQTTWKRLFSSKTWAARAVIQKEILAYGGELNKLETTYTTGYEEAQTCYEHQIEARVEELCIELVTALGKELVETSLQKFDQPQPNTNVNGTQDASSQSHIIASITENADSRESARDVGESSNRKRKRTCDSDQMNAHGENENLSTIGRSTRNRHGESPSNLDDTPLVRSSYKRYWIRKGRSRRRRDSAPGIFEPVPNKVYVAYRGKAKAWSAVVVLDASIPNTVNKLGLEDCVPECYEIDEQSGSLKWREGYECGGQFVTEREFPVVYFDGLTFPKNSATGWVAANDLQELNESSRTLIGHYHQVQKFLEDGAELQWDDFAKDGMVSGDGVVATVHDSQPRSSQDDVLDEIIVEVETERAAFLDCE